MYCVEEMLELSCGFAGFVKAMRGTKGAFVFLAFSSIDQFNDDDDNDNDNGQVSIDFKRSSNS